MCGLGQRDVSQVDVGDGGVETGEGLDLLAALDLQVVDAVGEVLEPEVAVGVGLDGLGLAAGGRESDGGPDDDFLFLRVIDGAGDELLG